MIGKSSTESSPKKVGKHGRVHADLIIHPIKELVTARVKKGPARGRQMHEIMRLKNAAVAVAGGEIIMVGDADQVSKEVDIDGDTKVIDASNQLVTPGLIDAHTHLIFGGNRANEYMMRCQGKSYGEIAAAGGGIVASMRATRDASLEELVESGRRRLDRMLANGTTSCEIKTGYGLSAESELKMLDAVYELADSHYVDVVPTFMPAHAIPPSVSREAYVEEIVSDMLPRAAELARHRMQNGAKGGDARKRAAFSAMPFVDVFCDEGYFTTDETAKIFEAARALNFRVKVHADEFKNLGVTTLATERGAASADHLLNVSPGEIKLLAQSDTIAVLLPGTSFYLNLIDHAPARQMIDSGVAVALASDFNPGSCHIFSLPIIWSLACMKLKMTAEEALTALTTNAAFAIGLGESTGQLTAGYQADITIYDVQSLEEVPYNFGWNPVAITIKDGVVASSK